MNKKLLEEYRKRFGPLFVGYKEGDSAVMGFDAEFSSELCGLCFKGKDKSGIIRICFEHFLPMHDRIIKAAFDYVAEVSAQFEENNPQLDLNPPPSSQLHVLCSSCPHEEK